MLGLDADRLSRVAQAAFDRAVGDRRWELAIARACRELGENPGAIEGKGVLRHRRLCRASASDARRAARLGPVLRGRRAGPLTGSQEKAARCSGRSPPRRFVRALAVSPFGKVAVVAEQLIPVLRIAPCAKPSVELEA